MVDDGRTPYLFRHLFYSLRWLIYVFNSVVNTKLPAILSHRRSITVSLETYPFIHIRTLVDRLHANIMALVRQDLQTKVTDAFARLNTRAPIARKETVGKKAFLIW